MKRISVRILASLVIATVSGLVVNSPVSADQTLTMPAGSSIHVGPQAPPAPREDHRWASPSQNAVWIAGHNEWQSGQYVWVGGYYGYPPHEGNHWVSPHLYRTTPTATLTNPVIGPVKSTFTKAVKLKPDRPRQITPACWLIKNAPHLMHCFDRWITLPDTAPELSRSLSLPRSARPWLRFGNERIRLVVESTARPDSYLRTRLVFGSLFCPRLHQPKSFRPA